MGKEQEVPESLPKSAIEPPRMGYIQQYALERSLNI